MKAYVGIDIGTTNIKAAVFSEDGEWLAYASRPNVNLHPQEGWADFDANQIWDNAAACLREVTSKVNPADIRAVGVSSMAECGVPLDADGNVLTPMIAWYDRRTVEETEEVRNKLGSKYIYEKTGMFLNEQYGLLKMMWTTRHYPEVVPKIAHWLSSEDYILYRLSGEYATDYTMAGRTLCFDLTTMDWSDEMLSFTPLTKEMMPKVYPGGTKIGEVTEACSKETGLLPGTAVCTGGHDHCCAAVGINIFGQGVVLDSMGTGEAFMVATDKLILNDDTFEKHFTVYPHCGNRQFRVLVASANSGVMMDWIFRGLGEDLEEKAKEEGTTRFVQMERVCEGKSGKGVYFYPMLRGTKEDSRISGTFVHLREQNTRGEMIQSALNGLCYEARMTLEDIEKTCGEKFDKHRVAGGISKSDLIMQRKSDVSKEHIEVPLNTESACFGAAILSAIGAGDMTFDDVEKFYNCDRSFDPNPEEDFEADFEAYKGYREKVFDLYR